MFNRVGNWLKTTVLGIIVLSALGSALWAGVLWLFQKSFGIFQDMEPGELINVWKILPYAAAALCGFVSTYWMAKKFAAREREKLAAAPVPSAPVPPPQSAYMSDDAYVKEFKAEVRQQLNDLLAGIRFADRSLWDWVVARLKEKGIITQKEMFAGLQFEIISKSLKGKGLRNIDWTTLALEYRNRRKNENL